MSRMSKYFTLIELLIVIVVIGILTAIVVPNVSSLKNESTTVAVHSNIKNIETGLTMYKLENNGKLPLSGIPQLGEPHLLPLDTLQPDYIRSVPKTKGVHYWVDYTSKVWASSASLPENLIYTEEGILKWKETENAVSFNVFKTNIETLKSDASNKQLVFVESIPASKDNTIQLPELIGDNFYLVSSVDQYGLESPPIKEGYIIPPVLDGDEGEGNPNNSIEEEVLPPLKKEEIVWKNTHEALTDDDSNTYYTVKTNENYVIEWEGDLSNRVLQLEFSTDYTQFTTSKVFTFVNEMENEIPFINAQTDERYNPYTVSSNMAKRSIDFVVPKGAKKLRIEGNAVLNLFKADFVEDLSLPHPVENLHSESHKDRIILKWETPAFRENFSKVAIYEGDVFLGYSSENFFTLTPLYSDTEHTYSIEPVSVVGNRGQRGIHTNRTTRPEIVWRGLESAAAFDTSDTTYSNGQLGDEITWIGELANRKIDIVYSLGISSASIAFYDKEDKQVSALRAIDNVTAFEHALTMRKDMETISFIVPAEAVKIKVVKADRARPIKFHIVSEGESSAFPSKLDAVTSTVTTESVLLDLNRPADVKKVALYRDGVLLAYVTSDFYEDKSLYSDRAYTYTFDTFNETGNRSVSAGSFTVKTNTDEINWSGLDNANAFDSSAVTYSFGREGDQIEWSGDLANRQINILYSLGISSAVIAFFDENNKQVSSLRTTDNITALEHRLTTRSEFKTISFVVPERAVRLKVVSADKARPIHFHDIREE